MLLELYDAARSKFKDPLSFLATEALIENVKPEDSVILTTGFVVPPWLRAENDGQVGALGLARAGDDSFTDVKVELDGKDVGKFEQWRTG